MTDQFCIFCHSESVEEVLSTESFDRNDHRVIVEGIKSMTCRDCDRPWISYEQRQFNRRLVDLAFAGKRSQR